MEKVKKAFETFWQVVLILWYIPVIVWYVPVAVIELVWDYCFDREKFKTSVDYIKAAIKGKTLRQ